MWQDLGGCCSHPEQGPLCSVLLLQKAGVGTRGTSLQTRAQVEVARLGEGKLGDCLDQGDLGSFITLFAAFHLDVKEDGEKGYGRKGLLCWCG